MNDLAQGCIIGQVQAQEWVSIQDERRPICLTCWKSLKFVKYFEILGKQMHLGYYPDAFVFVCEIFIDIS